ncbi:hypothetical protein GF324_01400 [bacterium]|nr:hypothetical protein [bacterium]
MEHPGTRMILLVASLTVLAAAAPLHAVDIYYTTCTDGEFENCRCPSKPLGGMEKRLGEIERRRAAGEEFLLVDSGNFMRAKVDSFQAETSIDIYELYDYDAVLPGVHELKQGRAVIEKVVDRLPVVAANLTYKDGRPLTKTFRRFERDGETVIITGLFDPALAEQLPPQQIEYLQIQPVEYSLRKVLDEVPAGATVVVLLHSTHSGDKEFASQWDRVNLVVGGASCIKETGVRETGGAPVVAAGANARYLGTARVRGSRARVELVPIRPELPDDPRALKFIVEWRSRSNR